MEELTTEDYVSTRSGIGIALASIVCLGMALWTVGAAWANVTPTPTPTGIVQLPAAMINCNIGSSGGNVKVHWGEAWSKDGADMASKADLGYLSTADANYDPWAKYRTEGDLIFPASWQWGSGKDLYDPTRQQPGLAPASGDFANAFYQNLPAGTLQWPTFDYQTFKDMAIAHGCYYGTDSSGNVYRSGIKDAAHLVSSFLTEFGVADRASAPYNLVFIDTFNGLPPAANGSNLATISVSGTGLGLKGVFWVGANFDAGGVGSPLPVSDAKDPNGNPPPGGQLQKIFLEGVLYAAGTMSMGGNAGIYGSIVAERGYVGGGTPDVWYNFKLASGLELGNGNIGSVFKVAMRTNY